MSKAKKMAAGYACQTREETQDAIREFGDVRRELTRIETRINDAVAAITAEHKATIDALEERADALLTGIHVWCEAHRAELTGHGGKTANLVTGDVSWRQRPPSVKVRAVDKVLETLKRLGLTQYIRTKEELNKEAILADPKRVMGVSGITVEQGIEDFFVAPFEVEVTS